MKAGLSLEKSTREEVEQALAKYPFFAMARMMVAKVATKENDPRAHGLRFLASLYAPHRQYYAFFMGDRVRPNVAPPPRIGGHEPQPPKQTPPSKEEAPASSDEPGPASPMPFPPEYLPRLQGKLKARSHLYRGLSERIRQGIRLPPIAPPPAPPLQEITPLPESPLLKELPQDTLSVQPPLSLTISEEPSKPSLPTGASESSLAAASPDIPSPTIPHETPPARLSPSLLILQFELEDKPPPAHQKPSAESVLSPQTPPPLEETPPTQPPDITVPPVTDAETDLPAPAPPVESAPPNPPLSEPLSAFSKAYVPLDTPEAPVSLSPSPVSEEPSDSLAALAPSSVSTPDLPPSSSPPAIESPPAGPPLPEPLSALSKNYVPLDTPEAPVSPSRAQDIATQPEESPVSSGLLSYESFKSESPIRLVMIPEFNPEGSIHLPVPEPTQEETITPIFPQETIPVRSETPVSSSAAPRDSFSSSARSLSPAWQSFLSEIEKPLVQVAQEALPHTPQTIEKLRQVFIRYLLDARKERRPPQEPPPPSAAIEEVLRLLETFQPREPEREASTPALMSIPESEASPPPPAIYTETMARLCWSQGDLPLAMEIYEKLVAKHPEKAAHYQAQIERIQRGERP